MGRFTLDLVDPGRSAQRAPFGKLRDCVRHETECGHPEPVDVEVIDVSGYQPPHIPSNKCRELIKKVWEVDPLICPHCGAEMKLIALIDDDEVIEKILRHLDLWPQQTVQACLSRAAPSDGAERIIEPCFDDPFPDCDAEPVMAYANDPDFETCGVCPGWVPDRGVLP